MNVTAAGPSRTSVIVELASVLALAALFVAAFRGRAGIVDVTLALAALALIGASTPRSRALWARVPQSGGPAAARRVAWQRMALFTGAALAAFFVVGAALGYRADGWAGVAQRLWNWHFLLACVLYLPWALLQQFIFQTYLLARLLALLPHGPAVLLAGAAFSLVHFPRAPVMVGTAVAGVVWAATYARYRTLLPLAVSHALLGAALHYWIFGRDLARLWGAL